MRKIIEKQKGKKRKGERNKKRKTVRREKRKENEKGGKGKGIFTGFRTVEVRRFED